jgi:hypothetical protein
MNNSNTKNHLKLNIRGERNRVLIFKKSLEYQELKLNKLKRNVKYPAKKVHISERKQYTKELFTT